MFARTTRWRTVDRGGPLCRTARTSASLSLLHWHGCGCCPLRKRSLCVVAEALSSESAEDWQDLPARLLLRPARLALHTGCAAAERRMEALDATKAEDLLRQIVTVETYGSLSRKAARLELEKSMNLPPDALKPFKDQIHVLLERIVDDITARLENQAVAEEEASNDDDAQSDGIPDAKRAKTAISAPKNLKKLQCSLMSKNEFLEKAPVLSAKVGDNVFDMKPRTFSSGSCGWFYGGKVPIMVGKQKIWCQLGINCTALGSKEWDQSRKRKK